MADIPERIFAEPDNSGVSPEWQMGWYHGHQRKADAVGRLGMKAGGRIEYVRLDIHDAAQARLADLERQLAEARRREEDAVSQHDALRDQRDAEKALGDQAQKIVAIAVDQYGARQEASSGKESRDWQSMKIAALDIQQAMQAAYRKARGL